MTGSPLAISLGAVAFGIVIGYITYRTLVRKDSAAISDISGVIGAVGGGAITIWFDQARGDSFAYYSMGLLAGMLLYYLQFRMTHDRETSGKTLGPKSAEARGLGIGSPSDTVGSPASGRATPSSIEDIDNIV